MFIKIRWLEFDFIGKYFTFQNNVWTTIFLKQLFSVRTFAEEKLIQLVKTL